MTLEPPVCARVVRNAPTPDIHCSSSLAHDWLSHSTCSWLYSDERTITTKLTSIIIGRARTSSQLGQQSSMYRQSRKFQDEIYRVVQIKNVQTLMHYQFAKSLLAVDVLLSKVSCLYAWWRHWWSVSTSGCLSKMFDPLIQILCWLVKSALCWVFWCKQLWFYGWQLQNDDALHFVRFSGPLCNIYGQGRPESFLSIGSASCLRIFF